MRVKTSRDALQIPRRLRVYSYLDSIPHVSMAFVNGTKKEIFQTSARNLIQTLQHWVDNQKTFEWNLLSPLG